MTDTTRDHEGSAVQALTGDYRLLVVAEVRAQSWMDYGLMSQAMPVGSSPEEYRYLCQEQFIKSALAVLHQTKPYPGTVLRPVFNQDGETLEAVAPLLAPVYHTIAVWENLRTFEIPHMKPLRPNELGDNDSLIQPSETAQIPLVNGRGYHTCEYGCAILVIRDTLPVESGGWYRDIHRRLGDAEFAHVHKDLPRCGDKP